MARPVMLSNGQMLVGLDEHGLVHDFYYPYVGLDNLTTSRSVHHKIGVWVDGDFSWVDDPSWSSIVEFEHDALISNITFENTGLGIKIESKDCVDTDFNAFVRHIKIHNLTDKKRNVRLFMHQVFQISRSGRADTAFYEPQGNYILDYKGRCALLIYGQSDQGPSDQYAVGNYGIEGKAGTFMDAQDGELSNNAVEHGGVDSVIRLPVMIEPNHTARVDYWVIASSSQYESEMIHKDFLQKSAGKRIESTRQYWQSWLDQADIILQTVPDKYKKAIQQSLLLIKAHIDNRGGILASGDSSIFNYGRDYYCYVWPRDGAYAIWPLIRMGIYQEAINYFEFCRDTLHRDGYLMHKYQPDRAIGSTWHPLVHNSRSELAIQEDETAIVLVMLGEYFDYSKDEQFVESLYSTLIQPTANFMARFIDEDTNLPHASYDLWEEKFLTSTYTTATVIRGLRRAAEFADKFEYPDDSMRWLKAADKIEHAMQLLFDPDKHCFRKGLLLQPDGSLQFDNTIDSSSVYGLWMYTRIRLDNPILVQSVNAIESNLKNNEVGGVIRYEGDWYMRHDESVPPNPWFICSLWLAQYYIQISKNQDAENILEWTLSHAYPSGALSEQVNPKNGKAVGVAPLVWSHAEVVNTILDLTNVN
jgi:GH15 family glucan-1,4-alpha-glucosidase